MGPDDPDRQESRGPQRSTVFTQSLQSPPPLSFDVSPLPCRLGLHFPPPPCSVPKGRQAWDLEPIRGSGLSACPPASSGLPPASPPLADMGTPLSSTRSSSLLQLKRGLEPGDPTPVVLLFLPLPAGGGGGWSAQQLQGGALWDGVSSRSCQLIFVFIWGVLGRAGSPAKPPYQPGGYGACWAGARVRDGAPTSLR